MPKVFFKLSSFRLETLNLRLGFASSKSGAFCSFEGLVRDHNRKRKVRFLEYEAHDQLCQKEALKILKEAVNKFEAIDARCFHRTGRLKIGEMSVWIGVLSSHRDSAFKACRYIIDQLKQRLPIWKKEFYTDGQSEWIKGS